MKEAKELLAVVDFASSELDYGEMSTMVGGLFKHFDLARGGYNLSWTGAYSTALGLTNQVDYERLSRTGRRIWNIATGPHSHH